MGRSTENLELKEKLKELEDRVMWFEHNINSYDVVKKELKETIKSQQEEIDKLKNRGIIKRIFYKG